MKKLYTLALLFSLVFTFGQYTESAPWNEGVPKSELNNFEKQKERFNNYWLTHDKNAKGSGYKPFMRWVNNWENSRNTDGTIISGQQLWRAWESKKSVKKNGNSIFAAPESNWVPVGPFTHTGTGTWSRGQGRVNVMVQDPNNANTIYVGTPAGGIWKSTNSGSTWAPLSDQLPQIGVSGIAIDPTNSNTIYIATGDRDASDTYSIGVLKSTNGGLTWNTTGLVLGTDPTTNDGTGDLIIHPTNNQILICATKSGLFKTTDAGANWNQILTAENFERGNVRFKEGDPTVVFASSLNKFYRSTNSGDTFTQITNGLPVSTTSRMIFAITPANTNYVYVLTAGSGGAFQGVYRSVNGGTSFTKTTSTTNIFESTQSFYDLALAASATNAEEIYTGCLNVWKSVDGGTGFVKVNNWNDPTAAAYTHADIHYLGTFGNNLYCGSDGGIFKSTDNADTFTDLTAGLQISQFYRISVSKPTASKMVGGLQDNGGYAFSNNQWNNFYGADGMDGAVSQTNPDLYYGFIQNGTSMYISNNGGQNRTGSAGSPGGTSGNWITPIKGNAAGEIFAGYNQLYKLTNNVWVRQNNTASSIGNNIECIEIDPSNDNNMFIVNGSTLYKSTDKGVNLVSVYDGGIDITSVEVHSTNSNIIYITTGTIDGDVYKSTDGGTTFNLVASGLPQIAKNIVVHQNRNTNNPLYVGTSLGVYYYDDTLTQWEPWDNNLPNVPVRDLEINIEDSKIIAATYGRGIWQSNIPVQVPPTDVKFVAAVNPSNGVSCNGNVAAQINVKNGGTNAINTVTVNYSIDNVAQTPFVFNGNIAANTNQLINLPSFVTIKGSHTLKFNITTPNDAYIDNNQGEVVFYINDAGTVGTVNPFTSAANDLIVVTDQGTPWVRGVRTGTTTLGNTGNAAYLTGISGQYANSTKTHLVSQCYNLANVSNPQISFKMKYDLEQDFDVVYVEYSTNFGSSWQVLGTLGSNWYNSDLTSTTSDCDNCRGAQWTGTNTTQTTYTYPLTSLNSPANVIFRIVFHTDEATVKDGVNVDDFVINGVLSSDQFDVNQVAIYPNPSAGIFTVSLGNIEAKFYEIYDLTGKLVQSNNQLENTNNLFNINLTNASKGVYFIKITTAETSFVKRIIKQ